MRLCEQKQEKSKQEKSKFHSGKETRKLAKYLCIVDVRSVRCIVQDNRQRAWDVIPGVKTTTNLNPKFDSSVNRHPAYKKKPC